MYRTERGVFVDVTITRLEVARLRWHHRQANLPRGPWTITFDTRCNMIGTTPTLAAVPQHILEPLQASAEQAAWPETMQ